MNCVKSGCDNFGIERVLAGEYVAHLCTDHANGWIKHCRDIVEELAFNKLLLSTMSRTGEFSVEEMKSLFDYTAKLRKEIHLMAQEFCYE